MRLAGIVSMLVGVGVVVQIALGLSLERLYYLRDLHASIGIVGLALIAYLFYASLKGGSALLKVMSLITLIIAAAQALLGLHLYFAPSISLSNTHLGVAIALLVVIAITGAISARSSRKAL